MLVDRARNELLATAECQVLIDVSSDDIIQRHWIENILCQLSLAPSVMSRLICGLSTLPYKEYYNAISESVLNREENYYKIIDSMGTFSILKIQVQKSLYSENLQHWIANKKKMLDDNIDNIITKARNRSTFSYLCS
ncbi:unnamed protein product [Rotaria magnacalcarata]|uniref:Uncharacterized protein n=1 Tax=Rotaria magnacalcarata TaxID=392030 RepID=A0A820UFJ8_9BILA|nr:unnamed protein product [Rotaria magnacalcarata]CAF2155823.1 unnamed protein product [Rotaria magnacalcarata]CAF2188229.1 unnamed protein product [Rotaria magnacalcarata]CAF4337299.1 unnamed protein product [Rotaria magnacalcarata]CAF4487112.1 unnamed protein product [Rotaria magnacalcarata]